MAAVDGQAATSHTVGEIITKLLEVADARLEFGAPGLGYPLPVMPGGRAAIRQQREHSGDVGQRDPDPLGDADQRHASKDLSFVPALITRGAPAADQTLTLIEMQRRDRHPAARGELTDGELGRARCRFVHDGSPLATATIVEIIPADPV